jgi:hypothetical protein
LVTAPVTVRLEREAAKMFALVRIDVAGRTFPLPRRLAVQTEPPSDTALTVDQSWFAPDGTLFLVLDDVENPAGLGLLAAAAVNGLPMDLSRILAPRAFAELADDGRVIIGGSRQEVMASVAPDYWICATCNRDLTIEDHRRPPCPVR